MSENLVRRNPDGSARKPQVREPHCAHPVMDGDRVAYYQPASACRYCSEGAALARWKAEWVAWVAENPDTIEARIHRGEVRP